MSEAPQSLGRRQADVHPALVDLAFVMAFLFLILSTLADLRSGESGREQNLPPLALPEIEAAATGAGPSESSLTVSLHADGMITVGQRTLYHVDALKSLLASIGPSAVELRAEASVPYGEVAKLLGLFQRGGIDEVSLAYESN